MFDNFSIKEKNIPQGFINDLKVLWNKGYSELYDDEYNKDISDDVLEDDIEEFIEDNYQEKSLIYLSWSLCLACSNNISAYYEFQSLEVFKESFANWEKTGKFKQFISTDQLPSKNKGPQYYNEALMVFEDFIKIMNNESIIQSALNILDSCLEGDAICPGADDKRAIFNWMITDVFPNAFVNKLSDYTYTMKTDLPDNWNYNLSN